MSPRDASRGGQDGGTCRRLDVSATIRRRALPSMLNITKSSGCLEIPATTEKNDEGRGFMSRYLRKIKQWVFYNRARIRKVERNFEDGLG